MSNSSRALGVCMALKRRYEEALLAIAHMDVYTREGEEEPHEVMRKLAKGALGDRT